MKAGLELSETKITSAARSFLSAAGSGPPEPHKIIPGQYLASYTFTEMELFHISSIRVKSPL